MSLTFIIILLVVAALLLFLIEIFLLPGLGVAGIAATGCVVAADVLVYFEYGVNTAILAMILSTVVVILFFWWFSKSKTLERVSLHSTISSTAATAAQLSVSVGDKGRAITRLALIGNAEIAGKTVEVKSEGGFVDEGTPVVVTRVCEALILVKPTA